MNLSRSLKPPTRVPVLPAPFDAIVRGSMTALPLADDGFELGDELILSRTLGGQYQGPGGVHLVTVAYVDRQGLPEGFCVVSFKSVGAGRR